MIRGKNMSINKIAADVNPRVWNVIKKSSTKPTENGTVETFRNGSKLFSSSTNSTQTVVDSKGNLVLTQIVDAKSGKVFII